MQESIGELLAPSWRPALAPTALFARAVTQAIGCPRAMDHVAPGLRARSRSSDLAVGEPVLRFVVFTLRGKTPGLDPLLPATNAPLVGLAASRHGFTLPPRGADLAIFARMPGWDAAPQAQAAPRRFALRRTLSDQLSFRSARFRASTHVRGWIHNPGGNER